MTGEPPGPFRRTALVTGPTGYIGTRLIPALLGRGYRVTVLTRSRSRLQDRAWRDAVTIVEGDAADDQVTARALKDVNVVYYLIHSMAAGGDFEARDRAIARAFARLAEPAGVSRIVYLGGLNPPGERLSPHLGSRKEVGEILLGGPVPATVLQAGIILGAGSASFEMLRHLTQKLPVMVTPKWLDNSIEPIAIRDVLHYLIASADMPAHVNRAFDIGCGDVLTYREMIQRLARADHRRDRMIATVPVLTPWLASHWVGLVTPVPAAVAKPLVGSLINAVVCREDDITDVVPPPPGGLLGFDAAVALALAPPADGPDQSAAEPERLLASDPPWAHAGRTT
jgi:uncharacterized protein YbjT (DUF2867 family)